MNAAYPNPELLNQGEDWDAADLAKSHKVEHLINAESFEISQYGEHVLFCGGPDCEARDTVSSCGWSTRQHAQIIILDVSAELLLWDYVEGVHAQREPHVGCGLVFDTSNRGHPVLKDDRQVVTLDKPHPCYVRCRCQARQLG